jgi:hypothetical protein
MANQNYNPYDLEQNGMNEYDRQTTEWNQSNEVREMRSRRHAAVNNTPQYYSGDRIHHIRSLQMCDQDDWNQLFGREILNQALREYAQASLDWCNDETSTLMFAGQMDVSLLMQENFRPGVHVAIFIIHLSPHRHFRDGHMVQMEFGEGSQTHQTVERMFDVNNGFVIIQQATEYQILGYLADDDEAMDLLHSCFLQPDFAPMRFSYIEPEHDHYGYFMLDPNAINNHRWHEFADYYPLPPGAAAVAAAIPPPNPVNNFAEIYQENQRRYDEEHPGHNIIPYNDDEDDEDYDYEDDNEEIQAQG